MFHDLGATDVDTLGNLKFSGAPVIQKQKHAKSRPTWLALSTHASDEDVAMKAHALLLSRFPDALLLLAPRHPHRFEHIETQLQSHQLSYMCWHKEKTPAPNCQVFVIDVIGQLDHYYPLADVCLVGGSFNPSIGGHSPIEPARHAMALILGPFMEKQADLVDRFLAAYAAQQVSTHEELSDLIEHLFTDSVARSDWQTRASDLVKQESKVLDLYIEALSPHFLAMKQA